MAKRLAKNQPMLLGFDEIINEVSPTSASAPSVSASVSASVSPSVSATLDRDVAPDQVGENEAIRRPKHPFPTTGDLVILVDSHSLIYQVFHALPAMTSPQGIEVGAAHGFLRDIANLLEQWKPDFLVCAFDASGTTFRNELYDQYKANREPMPDALREQIPMIHRCLDTLAIPKVSLPGFEADDILATLAHQAEQQGAHVLLVTSDKDCRQLISDNVQMLNVRKNELFGERDLKMVWGIRPDQVVDFQALVGDSSDNVPGVPQIGPKAAQQLLDQYNTLDEVYENIEQIAGDKRRDNLRNNRELAILSRDLVRLRQDCQIELPWSQMRPGTFDRQQAMDVFRELGFRKLSDSFLALLQQLDPAPPFKLPTAGYRTIWTTEQLTELGCELSDAPMISIDTETTSARPRDASLVGISFSWSEGKAAYVPVAGIADERPLELSVVQQTIGPILANSDKAFVGQNIKYDAIVLQAHGMPIANIGFDTMVADYLLDAGGRNHDLDDIAKRWLGHTNITIESLIGSGRDQICMDQVPVEQVSTYACEDVDVPFRLVTPMKERLEQEQLEGVMHDLEIPLVGVLVDMESEGIRIDPARLQELGKEFQHQADSIRIQIMDLAEEEFNPDSPKQLANILFEKLRLRVVKKTKTGPSTDAEVLEELASEHPLPAKIVEYRQLTKLINTYIDALPKLISPATNRVHTSFRQDIAATGRLSSIEPNLQNIPIRTSEGRSIRSAFLPREQGWSLLTADYSQIELRVLAHFCGDASLHQAFHDDIDIHTSVASQVNGVDPSLVTSEMRRSAKAVSFGIIYGQSPFGLAKGLGISRTDASLFIDAYFDKYPGVRDFIATTLMSCRRDGFVKTMSGRKRFLRGIRDYQALPEPKKKQLLEPERMAINTVIQGSAADMIKLAMIAMHKELKSLDWPARMLLQIHDELIFEVRDDYVSRLATVVREIMTTVMPLDVPLKVDVKHGPNWAECDPL
ncbi:MAG: DNA polymerase I [Pirellula sp.]